MRAAEELEAVVGDELHLFIEGEAISLRVKGVLERGGLAGFDSTTILPPGECPENIWQAWADQLHRRLQPRGTRRPG